MEFGAAGPADHPGLENILTVATTALRLSRLPAHALGAERTEALREAWRALWWSRLVVWVGGIGALVAVGPHRGNRSAFDPGGLTAPFGAGADALVAPAARWDSVWYLVIASDGYLDDERAAFFPLYPLLLRLAGAVVGSPVIGGAVVSLLAFLAALYFLHRLTELELGPDAARATVWLCALFPMSFFFSAVYSESLFLLLSVGAVYAARLRRWPLAAALGMLAAGTRSAGVLLLVPLVLEAIQARRAARAEAQSGPRLRRLPGAELWLLLVPAGLLAFLLHLALVGADPAGPFNAQEVWMRHFSAPLAGAWDGAVAAWDGARQLLSGSRSPAYFEVAAGDPFSVAGHNLTLFAFLAGALAAAVGAIRRLPRIYGAYVVAMLALPLSFPVSTQPLMSLPRFVAVLFPLFMWSGLRLSGGFHQESGTSRAPADRRRPRRWSLALSAVALAAFSAQFTCWVWVA